MSADLIPGSVEHLIRELRSRAEGYTRRKNTSFAETLNRAEADHDMSLHYAQNVRNSGPSNRAPEGVTDAAWHVDAIGDTRTSHTLPGRLYIVQCEWCDEAFAAKAKPEAMAMFRIHEYVMLNSATAALGGSE